MQNGTDDQYERKEFLDGMPRASLEDTRASSFSSVGQIQDSTQLLRLETITDTESRRIISFMKLTGAVAFAGAIITAALKESSRGPELIVLNQNFVIAQVVIFGVLLSSLLIAFAIWGLRVVQSVYDGMIWSQRRRYAAQAAGVRGVVATLILTGQVAANVRLLTDPAVFCYSKYFMPTVGFFIFVGFNTLLLQLVVDAHGTNLDTSKQSPDASVRDRPWISHWPKVAFVWLPFSGLVVWMLTMYTQDGHAVEVSVADGGVCGWGAAVVCSASPSLQAAMALTLVAVLSYFGLYGFYLVRAWRQLSDKLYQKFRMNNVVMRIQTRVNGGMVFMLLLSMALTWYLGSDACVNYAVTWFGVPSVSLIIVAIQVMAFYITYPRSPGDMASHRAAPIFLMQQFAWTEPEVPGKLAARAAAVSGSAAVYDRVAAAPLFCFETAIKLFFWSVLTYTYTEADPTDITNVPGAIRELIGDMDAAMRLFRLSKRHLFYDRSCGTKVLVMWNATTIVVAARGSAECANYLQDAKFLQVAHPPSRTFAGSRPRVHHGFLSTWHSNRFHRRVLAHISALLDSADDRSAVRVLCTGHSLGGAVAQLASFDIVRELGVPPQQISVYTFGCPRIGNHTLSAEFQEVVPDTWHVINDNDVVTRGMKLLGLYKRAGQRVIVNTRGDLIVRPSHLETSLLQRVRGGNGRHHTTLEYQRSLIAIVAAQLRSCSRHDDGLHGLLGLLKGVPQVRLALETHAQSLGSSLVDLVRDVGPRGDAAAATPKGLDGPLGAFNSRHHASLLRAAGGSAADIAAASVPEAAADDAGSTPGSPASDASGRRVPMFVRAAAEEGGTGTDFSPDTVQEGSAEAELLQDAATGAAAAVASRWRGASALVRVVVRLGRPKPGGLPSEDAEAYADTSNKRCNVIPEDAPPGAGAEQGSGEAAVDGKGGGAPVRWQSPLSARPEELPEGARLQGSVLQMGAVPDMRGCGGGRRGRRRGAVEAAANGPAAMQRGDIAVDIVDTGGSRTVELVDAAAKVDIDVAAVDSHGVAEAAADARGDDSGTASYSSSACGGGLRETSAQVLQEAKELGKTDSVGQGVSPITNSGGESTLSATGGGLSLSPVAPAGGAVMVEMPAGGPDGRAGGAAAGQAADGAGPDSGGSGGVVYARSIDNQLFLSDTARSSYLHPRGVGTPVKQSSPPGAGIGRRRSDTAARMELVDTDAVVLQMGGGDDGFRGAVTAGAFGSFGSTGHGTTGSVHQELSLMDADHLTSNTSVAGGLPPRPPSGAAAVGGVPTASAYLLGRSPGKDGVAHDARAALPCPLSIGRASDDDSMHLTTGSVWSCGDGPGPTPSEGGRDDESDSTQRVAGVGPNGLPILGWNQIPNQEPERVRGAVRAVRGAAQHV
eukprot:jgi/Ulvmu1/3616/UM017_0028.1